MDFNDIARDFGPLLAALIVGAGAIWGTLKLVIPKLTDAWISDQGKKREGEASLQAQMIKLQDRLLTVIEVDLTRYADDGKETRDKLQALADVTREEMNRMSNALGAFGSHVQLHTQTIARLADEVEGLRRNGTARRKGE